MQWINMCLTILDLMILKEKIISFIIIAKIIITKTPTR